MIFVLWKRRYKIYIQTNMEIEIIAEWDAICRICMQEGQLHSIFDYDDEKSELNIAEKIMECSPIQVSQISIKSFSF